MNFRKSGMFILVRLLGLMFALSGCINAETPKDSGEPTSKSLKMGFEEAERNSSFYIVGDAKGWEVERVTSLDGASKDVRSLKYRFEVCLEEKASSRRLQWFDFKIDSPEGEAPGFSTVEKTDEKGCLVWTENIAFDIGKPNPKPVLFLRKIKGVDGSSRKGEVSFIFQLYPWGMLANQEHPVFYYLRGNERNAYRGQIQKLFSGGFNPHKRLKFAKGEEAKLYVSKVGYDLTAIPFSIMNNTAKNVEGINRESLFENTEYPSEQEIMLNGAAAFKSTTNYVMLPEKSNPNIAKILAQQKLPPYRSEASISKSAFDGMKVDLVLKINLVQPYEAFDGPRPRDKRSGRFKVLPYLYASDYDRTGDRLLLNPEMGEMEAAINDKGDLNLHFKGILPFAPTSGRVELALQITPMDNELAKYGVVEEIFTVGEYDDLIGTKSALWDNPKNFNLDFDFIKYAKESKGYDEALKNSHIKKAEPFNFSLAAVRFKTIEAGETANKRTVIFNVKTCVSALNFETKTLEGREFEVVARHFKNTTAEKEDEDADNSGRDPILQDGDYKDINLFGDLDGDKIKTDANGCLNFLDKISHKYYQTERLMRRKYFLKAKGDVQNFTKELVLYLNPWDEKFGTLGTDARSVSQTFLKELNDRKKIEPRFYIQDFRYETLRFRYEIDENMNLVVKKTVLFRAYPRVMRYSNVLQGINSIFPIRDGIYLLKMAYQKDYLDPAAKGVRLRTKSFRGNPGDPITTIDKPLIEEVEAHPDYPNDWDKAIVIKTDKDSAQDEAFANAEGVNLDGSQKVLPPYDPGRKTSLSIVKKLVRVNSGAIVTPIEFSVEDLRLLRIRGQLFVQIEAINQTRLQIVNMASRKIEEIINLKKGSPTEIAKLPKAEQREIISKKMHALDTLAKAIPDNLEYTKDDASELLRVFRAPKVIEAFSPFIPGGELSSVAKMLSKESSEAYLLKDSVREAFEKEENFIEQLSTETNALRLQSTPGIEDRHYDVETKTTQAGQRVKELFYNNPESFYKMCGDDWRGYDHCVSSNKEKDENFNELLCKCFDNASKSYADVETDQGKFLTVLEDEVENLQFKTEMLSNATILAKIREKGDEFFKSLSGKEALTTLLLNDFTLAQAEADISDLDLLKDEVIPGVDIDKRTFVGPLTFLNNSNGGALRPTDNLDEAYCVTDDCNSLASDPLDKYSAIQNFDYERSPFHGSIAHFAGKHVDDFIKGFSVMIGKEQKRVPPYKEFKESNKKKYAVKALLSNFVEEFNLQYVALSGNKKLKAFICDKPADVDFETGKCLSDYEDRVLSKDKLLENFNSSINNSVISTKFKRYSNRFDVDKNIGLDFLSEVVKKDHGGPACTNKVVPASYAKFDVQEYSKFCALMTYGVFAKNYHEIANDFIEKVKNDEIEYSPSAFYVSKFGYNNVDPFFKWNESYTPNVNVFVDELYGSCLAYASKGEFNEPLTIERKYRIEETGRYYYLGGKSLNINLGQNIGISHKQDSNKLHKFSFDSLWKNFVPGIFSGYGYSYSRGEGVSANESLGITQGTFLVMQNAEFDVELKGYEQCLTVKWSDNFLKEKKNLFYYNLIQSIVRDKKFEGTVDGLPYAEHITKKLTEGLMLCSGEVEKEPIAIRETYYYFTQHFTEGDMQDRADIHNHPWLLSLRGVREFETFLAATHSDHDVAEKSLEQKYVQAEELIGMNKLLASDIASENLDGTSYAEFDKFKRNSWPLTQLIKTYRTISPTFPGLYTQLNRREYQVDQWPWAGSEPGEKFDSRENEGANCYTKMTKEGVQ